MRTDTGLAEAIERRAAMVELLEAAAKIIQQWSERFHVRIVLARRSAEREQALFRRFQAARIEIEAALRFLERRFRLRRFDRRLAECCQRRIEMAAGLSLPMFENSGGRA